MTRLGALLVLAILFAGCASNEETAAEVGAAATVVNRADDLASLSADDAALRIHDYWNGAERLPVIDGTQDVSRACTCEFIALRFRPEPGMIVPLGTSHLEVTVEWDTTGHGAPELWVKPASGMEPIGVGTIESGRMLVVPTTNDEADPPLQILSRWEFWVAFPSADPGARMELSGTVQVWAEAVRGLPIPALPPHTDPWRGESEILLFDEGVPFAVHRQSAASETPSACFVSCLPPSHRPAGNVTVPFDAREILVTFAYELGMPMLRLRYHGADSWELREPEPSSSTPTSVEFRIPVAPMAGDSPYAPYSLWEFQLAIDQPTPDRLFVGGYRITATALR